MEDEEKVPVIDISSVIEKDPDPQEYAQVLKKIDDASKKWGFFQILNHGVPLDFIEKVEKEAKRFFQFSENLKKSCLRTLENPRGFFNDEFTKNRRDWKEGFDFSAWGTEDGVSKWPEGETEFQKTMIEYFRIMNRLSEVLTKVFAINLGVSEDFFLKNFKEGEHVSFIRLNHYPIYENSSEEKVLGVGPHKDGSFLTILKQDDNVSSLQVYKKAAENEFECTDENFWVTIPPVGNALVVNVGAMLEVWSNMKYKAALHRVLTNSLERFSIPFFYSPSYSADVVPILAGNEEAKYRSLNYGEYRRLAHEGFYKEIPLEKQARLPNYRIHKSSGN